MKLFLEERYAGNTWLNFLWNTDFICKYYHGVAFILFYNFVDLLFGEEFKLGSIISSFEYTIFWVTILCFCFRLISVSLT